MREKALLIDGDIPALLWGEEGDRLLLAVHGAGANKRDQTIAIAAAAAAERGCCTLSFDLPEHGERAGRRDYKCSAENGLRDLERVYRSAREIADDISVFACSLGAYFTMLSPKCGELSRIFFLSPVVSMEALIGRMMRDAGVSEQRLEKERVIPLENGQTLSAEYLRFVREHPIKRRENAENTPMYILHAEKDALIPWREAAEFAESQNAGFTLYKGGEHYFHTEKQLEAFSDWFCRSLAPE